MELNVAPIDTAKSSTLISLNVEMPDVILNVCPDGNGIELPSPKVNSSEPVPTVSTPTTLPLLLTYKSFSIY